MKVVIIGNTGFIGHSIYNYLDKTKEYDLIGIPKNEIDLSGENSSIALSKYLTANSIVVMCAGVKKQLGDNLDTFERNSAIINNFCRAIPLVSPKKIIFFSSAAVYGEDVDYDEKINEKTPVQPKTYYGIAKYTAERLLEKICTENQTELVILRPPLIYGKNDLSRGYGPTGFTYKAIASDEIILWGNGSEFREFVFVDDVSRVVQRLLNNNFSGILNIVSGRSYTFREIVDLLINISKSDINIRLRQRSKEKVNHHYSNGLFKRVMTDFQFTQLDDGLTKMYKAIGS